MKPAEWLLGVEEVNRAVPSETERPSPTASTGANAAAPRLVVANADHQPVTGLVDLVLALTAALPSAANAAVLAARFGADTGRITRVILMSTVLSFATFTAAVALLL